MLVRHDLESLPKVIADLRFDILDTAHEINEQQAFQAEILADIDFTIASDATLTNDAKRKAARTLATAENRQLIELQ